MHNHYKQKYTGQLHRVHPLIPKSALSYYMGLPWLKLLASVPHVSGTRHTCVSSARERTGRGRWEHQHTTGDGMQHCTSCIAGVQSMLLPSAAPPHWGFLCAGTWPLRKGKVLPLLSEWSLSRKIVQMGFQSSPWVFVKDFILTRVGYTRYCFIHNSELGHHLITFASEWQSLTR